jgi:hypothetical protein
MVHDRVGVWRCFGDQKYIKPLASCRRFAGLLHLSNGPPETMHDSYKPREWKGTKSGKGIHVIQVHMISNGLLVPSAFLPTKSVTSKTKASD